MATQIFQRKSIADAQSPAYLREAEQQLRKAAEQKDRGQRLKLFEHVATMLQQAIGNKSRTLGDCLALAEANWELTKPQESIDYLKEAIQLAPKDSRPYALLGRYLLNKGLRDQAMNFLDRALALDPTDAASRRLRDRAALQQKKNYTVVINAKDFPEPAKAPGAAPKGAPAAAAAEGFENATQQVSLPVDSDVDAALASLLAISLVGADPELLTSGETIQNRGGFGRTLFALFALLSVGLLLGVGYRQFRPAGMDGDLHNLEQLVRRDQASSLKEAVEFGDDLGEDLQGESKALVILAHILLHFDHGYDAVHLDSAEALLVGADDDVRQLPPSLLARTLLQRADREEKDKDLEKDLSAAAKENTQALSSYLFMARAEKAQQLGADAASRMLLHQAAATPVVYPRALHGLATQFAGNLHYEASLRVLRRLWQSYPRHGPSLATGIVVAHLAKYKDREDGNGSFKATKTEKRVLDVVFDDSTEASDAALPALTLAALAQARDDAEERDRLLTIVVGAGETGEAKTNPLLMQGASMLSILEFDGQHATELLEENQDLVDGVIELQRNLTRAAVLEGVREKNQLTKIKVSNTRHQVTGKMLLLPAGKLTLAPRKTPFPLEPSFDPRYFPESAIQVALEDRSVGSAVTKKKLNAVAQIKLAQIAVGTGDPDDAMDYLDDVRDSADGMADFYLMEALVHNSNDRPTRARRSIDEAINIEPDEPRVLVSAARIQLSVGDDKEALKSVAKLTENGYLSPSALSVKARAQVKAGKFDAARKTIEQGQEMSKDDLDLLAALTAVECDAKEVKKARRAAAKMWRTSPERATAFAAADPVVGAFIFASSTDTDSEKQAIDRLTGLVKERPETTPAHFFLGQLYLDEADEKSKGIASLKEAAGQDGCGAKEARDRLTEMGVTFEGPESTEDKVEEKPEPARKPRRKSRKNRRRRR